MNRNEEYQELLKELESTPVKLDGTLERAIKRRKKQVAIYRPLVGMAAAFAIFVLLVNGSDTVAYACSQIPILRELAEAVKFSQSLSKAVENEYVQEINLVQRDGDVSAEIPYLIVDKKSVVVFYKLYSRKYETMHADKSVYSADGSKELDYAGVNRYWNIQDSELNYFRMEFDEEVPGKMKVVLDIMDQENGETEEYVAHFEFLLEFDPTFTSDGKMIELNKKVELDGQCIIIQDIEIYPTHMRINVTQEEENTAWLKGLNFYIKSGDEMFKAGVDGLVATGTMEVSKKVCYRAESIYFYNAEELDLVITGAQWLDKNQEKSYVNLKTGENNHFPANISFHSIENTVEGKRIWVMIEQPIDTGFQVAFKSYYDAEANAYYFRECGSPSDGVRVEGDKEYVLQYMLLENYKEDEIWLDFEFTSDLVYEQPITVQIK